MAAIWASMVKPSELLDPVEVVTVIFALPGDAEAEMAMVALILLELATTTFVNVMDGLLLLMVAPVRKFVP
jgi:hypothetical protein